MADSPASPPRRRRRRCAATVVGATALFLIGARQLGMAVIMHDASHRAYFSNKKWNDFAGNWLAAYPVWSDLAPYRPYHLQHPAHSGDHPIHHQRSDPAFLQAQQRQN